MESFIFYINLFFISMSFLSIVLIFIGFIKLANAINLLSKEMPTLNGLIKIIVEKPEQSIIETKQGNVHSSGTYVDGNNGHFHYCSFQAPKNTIKVPDKKKLKNKKKLKK